MSYYIDIIDTTSPLTQVVVENASASGITLEWNGGDSKDEASIVSSQLNFDMLSKTAQDAAFINFFTGDETRFKVYIKDSVDDAVIWQGFVIPDLYSEPYKNGCFFVSFTATDGLGRLKGKYLPEEYYNREKSLIDIYCQILKLTGLELDLYFIPAIENFVNKDWNTIYINTENFIDNKKKKDAYTILETLLQDTLCVCYQADNRWYIEGINQRNVRQLVYKKYDTDGVFVENVTYGRLLKNITPLVTPTITIIPPYNEITVTHKKIAPSLPKTINKEVNDGWAITTGVKPEIHSSSWMANGGYYAKCKLPDYYCTFYNLAYIAGLPTSTNNIQDDTKYISLREKMFIAAGQKIKFSFKFGIKRPGLSTDNPTNMLLWKNPFKYEILFNDDVIYSNFNDIVSDVENVIFNDSAEAEIAIEHIFMLEGLLDIRFYAPPGIMDNHKIEGIIINTAAVDVISFKEEEIITDLISGDFTIDKDIELTFADDKSGASEGFRLAKLKDQTTFFNEIEVPILYVDSQNSKLLIVQLEGANLIKENPYTTYIDDVLVAVVNVFYNYNNGEQMVVELQDDYVSGVLSVRKYAIDDVVASRNHWTQWTDAIYKIENSSYSQVVANIYRRIFNQAVEKLDVSALDAVKFNDIILFRYGYEKDFFVLNCSWNLDQNKTTLTLGRSHYKDASSTTPGDENIPPIVLAGTDIFIADGATTASLLATAYDPDGYIASQVWTKTVGGAGDVITTPSSLATTLTNLTEDYYTYQIQVTDSNGATAVDTINIIRLKDYTVALDVVSVTDNTSDTVQPNIQSRYALAVVNNVPANFVFTLSGKMKAIISVVGYGNGYDAWTGYVIEKNGAIIADASVIASTINDAVTLNYQDGDEIFIELTSTAKKGIVNPGDYASASMTFVVENVLITNGNGTMTGLPVQVGNAASISSD